MTCAAKLEAHYVANDRREHDCEERADIEQYEDFAQTPRKSQRKQYTNGEENVAANFATAVVGRGGVRTQQVISI